jgi:cation diffusion facilitator CzcD-associated flavoprotein CzcO
MRDSRSAAAHGRLPPRAATPEIAILGAGMSGLCMGIQLKRAGIHSFTIYEKSDGVGGTWRDNTYPGSGCDVPSHLYSFSFERRADWSRVFAEQPEILRYFEGCADKHDIRPHIRTGTEVVAAHFDDDRALWRLRMADGHDATAQVLVCACGQLNRPHTPDIPGLDTFGGTTFHSARWDHDHDLAGRSVAVIGNGASAIQFVPRIAPVTRDLTIFQRSANWIIRKPDRAYTRLEKWLFRNVPLTERLHRASIYWRLEARFPAFARSNLLGKLVEWVAKRHIRAEISDPELRRVLTPDYPVGCKRILISNDYYPTLNRPNVHVVSQPIERVDRDRIVTADGTSHGVDTLVLATGFQTTDFLAPMEIRGTGGRRLHDAWDEGAEAYLGVTVAGFPNLFMLYGPNTNLGHNSIIFMVECQVGYVRQCIEAMARDGIGCLDVRDDAMRRFNREVQSLAADTVWSADCGSWYKTESGKITNNWPDFTYRYRRRMRQPDLRDFHVRTPAPHLEGAAGGGTPGV